MPQTLAQRLQAVRARRFVGREAEIALFEALIRPDSPQQVLYVYGAGGVGKSSWIAQCRQRAAERGALTLRLDARAIPAEPVQILAALGLGGSTPPAHLTPAEGTPPGVLFIDTFEYWQALEAWVRDELLPRLPATLRIVVCSRRPPSPDWRLDPGWTELMQVAQIGNFSQDESLRYLQHRQIPEARLSEAIRFSYGNPLALAMTADLLEQAPETELRHRIDREATRQLVERFTREGTSEAQRAALQLAAVALEVDKGLLAAAVPEAPSEALFEWLSSLSFMMPGQTGLFPHDLVRDLLMAEMAGRQPGRYETLARTVFDHDIAQLLRFAGGDWRLVAAVILRAVFAIRAARGLDGFLVVNAGGEMYADLAQTADLPLLEAAVERHQGTQAAALFRHWRQAQPQGLVVLRSPTREPLGFLLYIDLLMATPEQRAADPLLQDYWRLVSERGSLPAGHTCAMCRFWMSLADHHSSSRVATVLSSLCLGFAATYPNLAVMSMVHSAEAEYWIRFGLRVRIEAPPELVTEMDGRRFVTMVADWRSEPRLEWLRQFARRVTEDEAPEAAAVAAPAGLDEAAFGEALREALQHLHETHRLQSNPLLHHRLLTARVSANAGIPQRLQTLRELLRETVSRLAGVRKTERAARILHLTYIEPARSQQIAADELGMGYSTYRRQLAQARALIAAELWQREV